MTPEEFRRIVREEVSAALSTRPPAPGAGQSTREIILAITAVIGSICAAAGAYYSNQSSDKADKAATHTEEVRIKQSENARKLEEVKQITEDVKAIAEDSAIYGDPSPKKDPAPPLVPKPSPKPLRPDFYGHDSKED